jgi:hypothetical protein
MGCNIGLHTVANSYVELAVREAGAVAEHAAVNKIGKYRSLPACYIFEPWYHVYLGYQLQLQLQLIT